MENWGWGLIQELRMRGWGETHYMVNFKELRELSTGCRKNPPSFLIQNKSLSGRSRPG